MLNNELCYCFVKDNNLPMPISPMVNDESKFMYFCHLYEDMYQSFSLLSEMNREIDNDFNGNADAFLKYFYGVRDKMINDILGCEAYKNFINADMNMFPISENLKYIPKGNVYNSENVGKIFLSIDLKSANFQALKFFDKSIVKNEDTYEEYLKHYTLSDYIAKSKYTRQVVFGKCNASRQIAIEKHLMSKFVDCFKYEDELLKLVRFNNDEVVFEVNWHNLLSQIGLNTFKKLWQKQIEQASKDSGVDVSYKFFKLEAVCLHSKKRDKDRNLTYVLRFDCFDNYDGFKYEFKTLPSIYHAITYKLYEHLAQCKNDYYFEYEGLDAYIDDFFTLKRFTTKEDIIKYNKENSNNEEQN